MEIRTSVGERVGRGRDSCFGNGSVSLFASTLGLVLSLEVLRMGGREDGERRVSRLPRGDRGHRGGRRL